MTKHFVPPPPTPDLRTRRYSIKVIAYARRLHEAGWSISQIRDLMERETGMRPSRTTVMTWVDEQAAETQRQFQADYRRRRRQGQLSRLPAARLTDRDLLALREEDDLSYTAITKVVQRFYGVEMTESQVRYRLLNLGVQMNENKSRAVKTIMASRTKVAA